MKSNNIIPNLGEIPIADEENSVPKNFSVATSLATGHNEETVSKEQLSKPNDPLAEKKNIDLLNTCCFVDVLIVSLILWLVSDVFEKDKNIETPSEYESLVCEDEFSLCDIEKEKICSTCSCVISIIIEEDNKQDNEVDKLKYGFSTIGNLLPDGVNATVVRNTYLSSSSCPVCTRNRTGIPCLTQEYTSIKLECCTDLLGANIEEDNQDIEYEAEEYLYF
eukprot:snap_masked-scaffold_8-processed-gene-14.77-mRNA-1 protein AED:1.00 eAED:1.00 QI:0/0/0/0/1/1/2/0/220